MNLVEEMLALRGALEIEFLTQESLQPHLDTFYQQISQGEAPPSIFDLLLAKQELTQAQIDFLKEGIEEDKKKKKIPSEIDIQNRQNLETFLGLRMRSAKEKSMPAKNAQAAKKENTILIVCPHCKAKYKLKADSKQSRFGCSVCKRNFTIPSRVSSPGSEKPETATTLGLGKKTTDIFSKESLKETSLLEETSDMAANPKKEEAAISMQSTPPLVVAPTMTQEPTVSPESNSTPDSSVTPDSQVTTAVISAESNIAPDPELRAKESMESVENAPALSTDFLPMPTTQPVFEAAAMLQVSTEPVEQKAFKTMELDIRGTDLFRPKKVTPGEGAKDNEEIQTLSSHYSLSDALLLMRHALNNDFIAIQDVHNILDGYYEIRQENKTENLAHLLVQEGYITKNQFFHLHKAIAEDPDGKARAASLDIDARSQVESFIGMLDTKRLLRITCPHCKSKFLARISIQGGKFRCSKCRQTFFLS